jgi:hypothetical protein
MYTHSFILLNRASWNNTDYHTNRCTIALLFYKSHVKHIKLIFLNFNPYTVHFCSVCTISQQMHYSDSLLITFYSSYMFRRMYVIIRGRSFECPAELH